MDTASKEEHKNNTPSWLKKLQRESWQAEILISGGALIGLISLFKYIDPLGYILLFSTKTPELVINITQLMVLLVLVFLVEGFLLHLILRAYWIGMIGISYVFPKGINQENLAFQGKFSSFIKTNNDTPYLIKIDKLCSLVFAFTFFVVFAAIGFFFFMGGFVVLVFFFIELLPVFIVFFFSIIYGLICIVTFVDFFTFGRLKRIKWFVKVYYPVHYLISRFTLSFLNRRLYYTLISNIKPLYIIVGLGIQIIIVIFIDANSSNLPKDIIPIRSITEEAFLNVKNNVINGKSLQFSITHIPALENALFEEWKKEEQDSTTQSFEDIVTKDKLALIGSLYEVYIDSTQIKNLQWMIQFKYILGYRRANLISLIDVSDFSTGSHQLIVRLRLDSSKYTSSVDDYFAMTYFFIDR